MAGGTLDFVIDADLHGLVDGHIDPGRRAEALRRLAGAPAERARVEAWQNHNDLLRTAFAGVEREPLPTLLNLKAKPRLHCLPAGDGTGADAIAPASRAPSGRPRVRLACAALLVVGAGIGSAWFFLGRSDPSDDVATVTSRTGDAASRTRSDIAGRPDHAALFPTGQTSQTRLPISDIPDLTSAGFSFEGADIAARTPILIQFRYRDDAGDRVSVSVAEAPVRDGSATTPVVRNGSAYSWHGHGRTYAVVGTVRPARLKAIASLLQGAE